MRCRLTDFVKKKDELDLEIKYSLNYLSDFDLFVLEWA